MLAVGKASALYRIDAPTVLIDTQGAPYPSWVEYATAYGQVENAESTTDESASSGPRREISRNMTLVIRCHPSQSFNPGMRVVDTELGDIYAINAVRHDVRRTTAFIDCTSGISAGGVP